MIGMDAFVKHVVKAVTIANQKSIFWKVVHVKNVVRYSIFPVRVVAVCIVVLNYMIWMTIAVVVNVEPSTIGFDLKVVPVRAVV